MSRTPDVSTAGLLRFEDLAPRYDEWFETRLGAYVHRREMALVRRLLQMSAGERLLEVGAGTGRFLRGLAPDCSLCVGLEPSDAMVTTALSRKPRLGPQYVRGRGENLPFKDNVFNGLLCMTVLEFAEDVRAVIDEAARVVRPGGRLVFGVLNLDSPWASERIRRGGLWASARFFRESELRGLLAPIGPVTVEYCVHAPPTAGRLPSPLLGLVDQVLARISHDRGALIGVQVRKGPV